MTRLDRTSYVRQAESMIAFDAYLGPRSFVVHGRRIRFLPKGSLHWVHEPVGGAASPSRKGRKGRALHAARIFVGLMVGKTVKWTKADVGRIALRVRRAQGRISNASIISQDGIYESTEDGKAIFEPSVQLLIMNEDEDKLRRFTRDMAELAKTLGRELHQEDRLARDPEEGNR